MTGGGARESAQAAPEVAADVEALMVAVQHKDGAAFQPRLLVQAAQQHHRRCSHQNV